MISFEWILYIIVYASFFVCSFYSLTCLDFSKFTRSQSTQKIYLLLLLLSLSLAWAATEAVFTLTIRQGF